MNHLLYDEASFIFTLMKKLGDKELLRARGAAMRENKKIVYSQEVGKLLGGRLFVSVEFDPEPCSCNCHGGKA